MEVRVKITKQLIRKARHTPEEVEIANRTARSAGAVGPNALCPRIVAELAKRGSTILDFGAGPQAIHSAALRKAGFKVTPYEFGANVRDGVHDQKALDRQYDVVMASNVLNVQPTLNALAATLREIHDATKPGGLVVANYPQTPRKLGLTTAEMREALAEVFEDVRVVGPLVYAGRRAAAPQKLNVTVTR